MWLNKMNAKPLNLLITIASMDNYQRFRDLTSDHSQNSVIRDENQPPQMLPSLIYHHSPNNCQTCPHSVEELIIQRLPIKHGVKSAIILQRLEFRNKCNSRI